MAKLYGIRARRQLSLLVRPFSGQPFDQKERNPEQPGLTPFGQLPFLVDGGCPSNAIATWVSKVTLELKY